MKRVCFICNNIKNICKSSVCNNHICEKEYCKRHSCLMCPNVNYFTEGGFCVNCACGVRGCVEKSIDNKPCKKHRCIFCNRENTRHQGDIDICVRCVCGKIDGWKNCIILPEFIKNIDDPYIKILVDLLCTDVVVNIIVPMANLRYHRCKNHRMFI